MNPFHPLAWLRLAAKNAIVGGVQDGLQEVAGDGSAVVLVRLELPALAAPPAPESTPEAPVRARKKSD